MTNPSFFSFVLDHQPQILKQTIEHLSLTMLALSISILVSLPLGIILTRTKKVAGLVLGFVGVIQTIPSVALLGFLIPFLGIGETPAIFALFLYALLPIVRNTYTGIDEVTPAIKEAAKGMGMSDFQVLYKVELPLAIPIIFAGIRTAVVINVGVATLCALIGAGGLGQYIFRGIALDNTNMILAGALPAAMLALGLDLSLALLQKIIHRVIKPLFYAFLAFLILVIPFLILPSMYSDEFRLGLVSEFMERGDGYPGLKKTYGLTMKTVELDPALMYRALYEKTVDSCVGFSTDGRIEAHNFIVLEDDKQYFPPYYGAAIVRGETLRKYPQLETILNKISQKISNETITNLNFQVDEHQKDPYEVAKTFLEKQGFRNATKREGKPDIVIGSKNFTEQYILAQMFGILIENYSDLNVEFKTGLAGTKICFGALKSGEIDLYPEYTGTGFLVILQAEEEIRDKILRQREKVYQYVKKETKERFDVIWLKPLGFNNTYALMMRKENAKELGIKTISDMQAYVSKQSK